MDDQKPDPHASRRQLMQIYAERQKADPLQRILLSLDAIEAAIMDWPSGKEDQFDVVMDGLWLRARLMGLIDRGRSDARQ